MLKPFLFAFFLIGMLCGCNGDSGSSETVTPDVKESPSVEPETRSTKTVVNKTTDEENELDVDNVIQPRIGDVINTGKTSDTESITTTHSPPQDTSTPEKNDTSSKPKSKPETTVPIEANVSNVSSSIVEETTSGSISEQTTADSGTESSSASEQTSTNDETASGSQTNTDTSSTPGQTPINEETASDSQTSTNTSSTSKQTTSNDETASGSQTYNDTSSTSEQTTTSEGTTSGSQTETSTGSTSEQTATNDETASNSQTGTNTSSTHEQITTNDETASDSQTGTDTRSTSEQATMNDGTAPRSQTYNDTSSTSKQTATNDETASVSQTDTGTGSTPEQTSTNDETVSGPQTGTDTRSTSEQTATSDGTASDSQTGTDTSSTSEQATMNDGTASGAQADTDTGSASEQTSTNDETASGSQTDTDTSSTPEQTATSDGTASDSQTDTDTSSTPEQTATSDGTVSGSQTDTGTSSTSEQTATNDETASVSQTDTGTGSTPEQTTTNEETTSGLQTGTNTSSASEQTTTSDGTTSGSQTETSTGSTSEQIATNDETASNSQTGTNTGSTSEQTATSDGTASDSQTGTDNSSTPEQTAINKETASDSQTDTETSSTSGSKTGTTPNTSPTYRFIDSPVEGLFYTTSSGHSGVTDTQGHFEANEGDVVTFYLGDENGIKLGAASVQTVLTPFEITGKHTRAVALARLLLSLDNHYGLPSDNTLTIPNYLSQSLSKQNLAVLSYLRLNNMDSVRTVLIGLGVSSSNIVTESQAVHHLKANLKQINRGESSKLNPFSNRENMHIKHVLLPQNQVKSNHIIRPIHVDKTLNDQYFGFTNGMPFEDFTLTGDILTKLSSSNSNLAQIPANFTPAGFYHTLLSTSKDSTADILYSRQAVESGLFSAQNQTDLYDISIKVRPLVVNQWWERQVTSFFYDPATQVFTKTEKIAQLSGSNIDCGIYDCLETWSSEAASYYYPVSAPSGERYIDFIGIWLETRVCFDGTIAKRTFVFDDTKLTATGSRCLDHTAVPIMGTLEHSYEDLQHTEFWWFNQTGRQSKATLSELNSTIRLTSPELYPHYNSCVSPHEITVKWEYHPAGENWDRGLLNRMRMSCDGTINLYSTMQKQF